MEGRGRLINYATNVSGVRGEKRFKNFIAER